MHVKNLFVIIVVVGFFTHLSPAEELTGNQIVLNKLLNGVRNRQFTQITDQYTEDKSDAKYVPEDFRYNECFDIAGYTFRSIINQADIHAGNGKISASDVTVMRNLGAPKDSVGALSDVDYEILSAKLINCVSTHIGTSQGMKGYLADLDFNSDGFTNATDWMKLNLALRR